MVEVGWRWSGLVAVDVGVVEVVMGSGVKWWGCGGAVGET